MIARKKGFTLVELIVVIATIGILASVALLGLNRYQGDTRDARRASSVSVIAEALEKYYDQSGEYPSCTDITATAADVTANTLKGINPAVLVAPLAPSGETNSIECIADGGTHLSTSSADFFEYVGDGSAPCITGDVACLSYTLKYKEEATSSIKSLDSRRTTDIATSGNITNLSATPFSFSRVDLAWAAIGGAANYTVQWSINNFSSVAGESTATTNAAQVTGLTFNTLYYFRVKPNSATSSGNFSNIAQATTLGLDTPTGVATANSASSQISFTWNNNIANATSYTVEHANNINFTGATTTTNATPPKVVGSLAPGTTLYFRVKAVASGFSGGWSAESHATIIADPPSYTISSNWDGTYLNATSNAICASGTTATFYWYVNGSPWVTGDAYRTVAYAVPYNQPISLTVNSRCYTSDANGAWVPASNDANYNRPAVVIQGIQKVSGGSSNGHRVWFWWNNLCGGTNQIIGYQGAYNTGWITPNWNAAGNPAAGATAMPYSVNDTRNWNSGGTVTYYARQDCGGWQQSVNSASIAA